MRLVFAATARDRSMAKLVLTPAGGAARLRQAAANHVTSAILFGNERAGLSNDEVALADCIITIPTAPDFSSLNLGRSVLLIGYEWFDQRIPRPVNASIMAPPSPPLAKS